MMKWFLGFIIVFQMTQSSSSDTNTDDHIHNLQKRGLFYPWLVYSLNAATGILVAIAIPLHDIDDRNVFVSYNFEANYNMPGQPRDSFPGPPFTRWKLGSTYEDMNPKPDATPDDIIARGFNSENNQTIAENSTKIKDDTHKINERSIFDKMIFTRKGVYRALESRLNA